MQPRVVLLYYNQVNPALDRTEFPLYTPEDLIEFAGRWDYGDKSIAKMGDKEIIGRWIGSGEESMVEMGDATFFVVCSRVVSHELVRHRLMSVQQESQRYVNYENEEPELLFYEDPVLQANTVEFKDAVQRAWETYRHLIDTGAKKQIARYVLPNATRVRMVVKANVREWRHILKLRMHKSAQPEMQIIANQMHDLLLSVYPNAMKDIRPALEAGERAAR